MAFCPENCGRKVLTVIQNPLLEKRPRNFGIGQDIQPKRNLSRAVKSVLPLHNPIPMLTNRVDGPNTSVSSARRRSSTCVSRSRPQSLNSRTLSTATPPHRPSNYSTSTVPRRRRRRRNVCMKRLLLSSRGRRRRMLARYVLLKTDEKSVR
jgi:hypothetical protein